MFYNTKRQRQATVWKQAENKGLAIWLAASQKPLPFFTMKAFDAVPEQQAESNQSLSCASQIPPFAIT